MVFLGISLLFGAMGWWGGFYGNVVLQSGFASPDPSVLLPCVYAKFGTCAFVDELSLYGYAVTALWATVALLAGGLILRLIPQRTPTSILPTLAQREPMLVPQLATEIPENVILPAGQDDKPATPQVRRPLNARPMQRQMRTGLPSSPSQVTQNWYGPSRGIAAVETYAYMDTGRSNLAVIGLALLAAICAGVGLQFSFPSFAQIQELAPPGALAPRPLVNLAEFPKPVTVLTRGQIFRDLQFSARGELVGEDRSYFVTLDNSKIAIVDSRSRDYRALVEVNDGRAHQFVIVRRGSGEVVLADSLKGTRSAYDPAITFSPSEERVALKAVNPIEGQFVVVMDLAGGAKHKIDRPAFPKPKKGEAIKRNSAIFLETMQWLGDSEIQYLAAFECLGPQKTKSKCEPGDIELYAIRAQTEGPILDAKRVARFAKPPNVALDAFVSDQFRTRLKAFATVGDGAPQQKNADLKMLAQPIALFAETRSLDASNPFSKDILLALFQEPAS